MSAFDLQQGQSARVVSVNIDGAARERLKSLGVIKGAKITLIAFSFFDYGALFVCGYIKVALRKSVAERIEVALCR